MQTPGHRHPKSPGSSRDGVVLVVTIVLLVVLSALAYTLTSRVARQVHRNDYLVDYTRARYACDSAVRYALATLEDIEPELISRPNEPDFSDLFIMSDEQIEQLLQDWAALTGEVPYDSTASLSGLPGSEDANDLDALSLLDTDTYGDVNDMNDPAIAGYGDESLEDQIRGPYGPRWPLITETAEFEIGDATVTIEIEDENAKYPLGWALLSDEEVSRESEAGFETFCEWMRIDPSIQEQLRDDFLLITETKPFTLEFKPITTIEKTPVETPKTSGTTSRASGAGSSRTATVSRVSRTRTVKKTVSIAEQIDRQSSDFGKLLNSALFDRAALSKPTLFGQDQVESLERDESAMKYLSIWGTRQVNVNTAPRHVLEAMFMFGGDGPEIAQGVIERRRKGPFKNLQDLTTELFEYQVSLNACEKYIAYKSTTFTIHVKAVSGTAKAYSTIAIKKDGKKVKRIAVING